MHAVYSDSFAVDGRRIDEGDCDGNWWWLMAVTAILGHRSHAAVDLAGKSEGVAKNGQGTGVGGVVWLQPGVDDDRASGEPRCPGTYVGGGSTHVCGHIPVASAFGGRLSP